MNYYFINTDNKQVGPLQPEELAAHGVNAATYVWREGLANWVRAGELPELAACLTGNSNGQAMPPIPPVPPPPPAGQPSQDVPAPESYMVTAIVGMVLGVIPLFYIGLFLAVPFGVAGLVFDSQAKTAWRERRYPAMEDAVKKARIFSRTSLAIGIGCWALLLLLIILATVSLFHISSLFPY